MAPRPVRTSSTSTSPSSSAWPWIAGGVVIVAGAVGAVVLLRKQDRDTVPGSPSAPRPPVLPVSSRTPTPGGGIVGGHDVWGGPTMPLVAAAASIDLRTAQKYLHSIGYDLGTTGPDHDGVDGVMTALTETALRDYQDRASLLVTGTLDLATRTQVATDIGRVEVAA